MISDLAINHDWQSILDFDEDYRSAQTVENFSWGADIPILREKLKPIMSKVTTQYNGNSWQSSKKDRQYNDNSQRKAIGSQGKTDGTFNGFCRNFNSTGTCTFEASCKYKHACLFPNCGEPHPDTQHPQVGN